MTKGCWRNFARWSLIGCQTKENTVSNTCTLSVPRIKHSSSCDATKVDKTLSFLLIDPPRQTELRSSPNMFALHTLAGLQADLVRRDLTNWYGLCTNLFLTSSWFMSVYMCISIYIYIYMIANASTALILLKTWSKSEVARSRSQDNKNIPKGSRKYSKIKIIPTRIQSEVGHVLLWVVGCLNQEDRNVDPRNSWIEYFSYYTVCFSSFEAYSIFYARVIHGSLINRDLPDAMEWMQP